MVQILYILLGMVILLFALAILLAVLPDKKEKEEKPINKFPYTNITLQFETEDAIYTLYDDYSWEVDVKY